MRACFLGQNVAALGYGVAMLQTPPLPEPEAIIEVDAQREPAPEAAPPASKIPAKAPEAA